MKSQGTKVRSVWADLNTAIIFEFGLKQSQQDPLEEVVSFWSQTNSVTACLQWECDLRLTQMAPVVRCVLHALHAVKCIFSI